MPQATCTKAYAGPLIARTLLSRGHVERDLPDLQVELCQREAGFGAAHQGQEGVRLATQAMADAERRDGLVRTWSTPDWVGLEVLDTGPGIAPDVLSRIFEPFFTTRAHRQGTGLGLSISHGIIRAHGGEIRGENRPEGGARFTFQLPRDPTRIARTTDA